MSNLPTELLDELSSFHGKRHTSKRVLYFLEDHGPATIDDILIGLYHEYKLVYKRPTIATCLFRLKSEGLVLSSRGRPSIYSLADEDPQEDSGHNVSDTGYYAD